MISISQMAMCSEDNLDTQSICFVYSLDENTRIPIILLMCYKNGSYMEQ